MRDKVALTAQGQRCEPGLLLSLFGFNLGVEIGQGLVVAVSVPALLLLRRTRWEPSVVKGSSLAILVAGLALFVERALF